MFQRKAIRRIGVLALIAMVGSLLLTLTAVSPAKAAPPPLELNAKSAILIDYASGQVLYEKNADEPIPPASLTKLMTLHLAYKKIDAGQMSPDDLVQIRPEAWAAKMLGSSVMFLEPGQIVTVGEIMKGIAIPSGNDASVAMAQHIAGSVDAFVAMMNDEAKAMGFQNMHFTDPAGLEATNTITAREFAEFARQYIQQHPQALTELHSVREFTYPQPQNLPEDKKNTPAITQQNRNTLLGTVEGVDGLKTGFISQAGYNIALTAKRGDMRLIAVILGVPGATEAQGSRNRAEAGTALLQWGFQNFAAVKPDLPAIQPVKVWKGRANQVEIQPAQPVVLTVPRGLENKITATVEQETSVIAPIAKGTKLGQVVFTADGEEIATFDLVAANDVEKGNWFKRLWDTIRMTVLSWFRRG